MHIEMLRSRLHAGLVIPACPLALHADGAWSLRHQRALVRYYVAAGAGGLAVGVHSTQFAIREPQFGLFEPVLRLVAEELQALRADELVRIAGICGDTTPALREAELARSLGYHAGLVSLVALKHADESAALKHVATLAEILPVVGFYLQPAVGGRVYSAEFWRRFAEIPHVVAIKIAPFNRYQTWDVVRGVIEAGRDDIALYTGNDDNIIVDLLTPFEYHRGEQTVCRFIAGGLLGQWGVWTRRAVELLAAIQLERGQLQIAARWLSENVALTDANAAIFDAAHNFSGCIPGILEVLRRAGLVPSCRCLDPHEQLSPGQAAEIDRIWQAYPQLRDDEFVAEGLESWLAP